jgi:hypothetical protein
MSYRYLLPLALILGLAPFLPRPHLVDKVTMLMDGSLRKPIDIFDLVWHGWPLGLLLFKVIKDLFRR